LRISSYIRKPFLIYDFATLLIYEENLIFFFISAEVACPIQSCPSICKVLYRSLCGKDLEGVGEVENDVEYVEGCPGYEEGEGHQHQHEVRPLAPLQLTRPP
jgi:hypothetical protein